MSEAFLVSFYYRVLKIHVLQRIYGSVDLMLPLVLMSDIHDGAGLALGFLLLPTSI